jgi:hypothetical protein
VHQPQQVATWLLDRFAPEALVGDLLEEYATGHSRLWYCWQVVLALLIGVAAEFRVRTRAARRAMTVASAYLTSRAVAGVRALVCLASGDTAVRRQRGRAPKGTGTAASANPASTHVA